MKWSPGVRRLLALVVAGLLVGVAAAASAQTQAESEFDTQTFEPALGPYGIFTVERTGTLTNFEPGGQLVVDYLSNPLVEEGPRGTTREIVSQQLVADFIGGLGIGENGQLAIHLPVYFVNDVSFQGRDLGGSTVGDLRLTPKYQFLDPEEDVIGLGASVDLGIPTGRGEAFVGSPTVTAEPKVLVDYQLGELIPNRTVLAANLGVRLQGGGQLRNINTASQFTYRLGVEQEIVEGLVDVGGELYGRTPVEDFFGNAADSPLEGVIGAKVRTELGLIIQAGAGGGLVPGVGAPGFRAFLGVSYPGEVNDSDGDGIADAEDQCPDRSEDLDGFNDGDGCPDPDNDGDGIPDDEDECPEKAETKNGFEDEDGCPDAEKDSDGDGIPDAQDACPEKSEDEDGYKDEDGCPDSDNDSDGIPDDEDECPTDAEDNDGDEDQDGCPEATDSDGDGIVDKKDECPDEPGLEKNDGCPAKEKKAVRKDEEIENLEKIYFEYDKAVLKKKSTDVLDQIGLILRSNPEIETVRIVGHTDDIGSEKYNRQLSEQRAKAVREYLTDEQEVAADRLETEGMGATEPLVPNTSKKNRKKNRRVEFNIAEEADGDGGATSSDSGDADSETSDGNAESSNTKGATGDGGGEASDTDDGEEESEENPDQ